MTRDELKKLAERVTHHPEDGSWCMNPEEAYLQCYDDIMNSVAQSVQWIGKLGWRNILDQQPTEEGMYLVNIKNARTSIARYDLSHIPELCCWTTFDDEAGLEGDITHWMPLPQPPKENK